jgi:hypothetical protein
VSGFARYSGPLDSAAVRVPYFHGPVDRVDELDELWRDAFRWGRVEERYPEACDRANAQLQELGVAVLGSRELVSDVGCWLGDGPCEDGSVLEALAELHNEGFLNLGLPARRQCTAAGWPIYRVGPR